jgi:membrane protein required for colicin V production
LDPSAATAAATTAASVPPQLNIVDYIVFGIILLSGLLALFRGFVREVLSLASWVGAAAATVYFYPQLRPWMHAHIKSDFGADALTGLVLFCLALAILIPIGYLISGLVRGRALTAVDRSLGFVFGLARGVLVVCLLCLITLWIWPDVKKTPDELVQARTRLYMVAGAAEIKSFLPKEEMDKMDKRMDALDIKMEEAPPSLEQLTTPQVTGSKPATTVTTSGSGDVTVPVTVTTTGTPDNQAAPPAPPTPPPTPPPGR